MSVTQPTRASGALPGLAANPAGVAWFLLAVVAALPLFWIGFTGLATAWARPEYSHGPVIPCLSFYIFLREMRFVPPVAGPVADRGPGVAVVALALAIATLGNLVQIDDIVFYALIVWIGGLVLTLFGARRGITFWPSVLHLVFMLPLPQFLYWRFNTGLQFVSSEIGVWFVGLMGVPVYLDGNVIDLGVYKLQVAEACSGLRYLFPIMSFSYVFAVLYRGPVWHKLTLLAVRDPGRGADELDPDRDHRRPRRPLRHRPGRGLPARLRGLGGLSLLHRASCFCLAKAMQWVTGDRRPLGEALDLDFSGLGGQLARVMTIVPSRALVGVALITVALSVAWTLAPRAPAEVVVRDPYSAFPLEFGGWSGTAATLDANVKETLGADDYLTAFYRAPGDPEGVDLFLSYYRSQTNGNAIHSPEVCLPAAGWEVAAIRRVRIDLPGTRIGIGPGQPGGDPERAREAACLLLV